MMDTELEIIKLKNDLAVFKKSEIIRWAISIATLLCVVSYLIDKSNTNRYDLERNFNINKGRIDSINLKSNK